MRKPNQRSIVEMVVVAFCFFWVGSLPAISSQFSDAAEAKAQVDMQYAFANFYQLALQGDANAMFELSLLFSSGKGVPLDKQRSMRWLKQAASLGNIPAQSNLGVAFNRGISVPQNSIKAFVWLSIAATSGDNTAATNLEIVTKRLSEMQLKKAQAILKECKEKMNQILSMPSCI